MQRNALRGAPSLGVTQELLKECEWWAQVGSLSYYGNLQNQERGKGAEGQIETLAQISATSALGEGYTLRKEGSGLVSFSKNPFFGRAISPVARGQMG